MHLHVFQVGNQIRPWKDRKFCYWICQGALPLRCLQQVCRVLLSAPSFFQAPSYVPAYNFQKFISICSERTSGARRPRSTTSNKCCARHCLWCLLDLRKFLRICRRKLLCVLAVEPKTSQAREEKLHDKSIRREMQSGRYVSLSLCRCWLTSWRPQHKEDEGNHTHCRSRA